MNKKISLLDKYTKIYQKNPKSRVFAPLAESYRKLGMIAEALDLIKKGLKIHPSYVLAYLVLARCYADQQKWQMCRDCLSPFVESNLDNISLQKLYAQACEKIGENDEALQTFKYLLFLNPKDAEVAFRVKQLEEEQALKAPQDIFLPTKNSPTQKQPEQEELDELENFAEWEERRPVAEENQLEGLEDEHQWSMNTPLFEETEEDPVASAESEPPQVEQVTTAGTTAEEGETPFVTLTLVDLYMEQGHKDKAIEVLKKIIEGHPNHFEARERLQQLTNLSLVPEYQTRSTQLQDQLAQLHQENNSEQHILHLKSWLENVKARAFEVSLNQPM